MPLRTDPPASRQPPAAQPTAIVVTAQRANVRASRTTVNTYIVRLKWEVQEKANKRPAGSPFYLTPTHRPPDPNFPNAFTIVVAHKGE